MIFVRLLTLIPSPPIQLSKLLTGFQSDPLSLVALCLEVVSIFLYLKAVATLKAKGRSWPIMRTVSFMGGILVVFIATGSGFASYDDTVFTIHVLQHLMLMNLAPIFIALSAPITLLLQASRKSVQTKAIKFLHSKLISFLTFPVFAWLLSYTTMYVYFLTPVYQLSIEHPLFHDYTHFHFLIAGMIFWTTLIGIDPVRWKMSYGAKLAYLLLGIPFNTFLGIALTSVRTSISPAHTLTDVHIGGALLWILGEVFTIAGLAIIFFQWARHEERIAIRSDRELDQQIARTRSNPA